MPCLTAILYHRKSLRYDSLGNLKRGSRSLRSIVFLVFFHISSWEKKNQTCMKLRMKEMSGRGKYGLLFWSQTLIPTCAHCREYFPNPHSEFQQNPTTFCPRGQLSSDSSVSFPLSFSVPCPVDPLVSRKCTPTLAFVAGFCTVPSF